MSYQARSDDSDFADGPSVVAAARRRESSDASPQGAELPTMFYQHRQLGRYRICLKVASGGMADVYLACVDAPKENEGLHRVVALKVLHANLTSDPQYVDMFFDEARVASLIHHPFVCGVLDFGAADGTYFLAMELLVGESLKHVRRALAGRDADPDPVKHAAYVARVLADACEGLHAAHEACDDSGQPLDVVHRDVAPDNLFLTYDGVVKVVDFGVAKVARGRHRTRTGIIKGKMDYIAPELLRGARADRRADIWGLGAVLWEMLTLRRLFRRSTDVATLGAVLGMDITPPSKVRTGLPKELDAIVMRALARSPGERYATARDMGRDLVRFLAQRGEAVGNADLSDWMDQIFPGGRSVSRQLLQIASRPGTDEAVSCVRQAAWHGVDSSSCSGPSPSLPPPLSLPPPRRRWHVGLLVAALIAALAGLAVAVVGQTRRSHGPAIAEPSKEPPAPGPISPTAAPLDPRQPLVLEVAATRESGERHTLFRIRSAPGGDLVVDDSAPGAAPDSTGVRPAHK